MERKRNGFRMFNMNNEIYRSIDEYERLFADVTLPLISNRDLTNMKIFDYVNNSFRFFVMNKREELSMEE